MTVREGEIVAILGPSGSGKTTLLHLLAGLDRPTTGRIWWGDTEVTGRTPRDLTIVRRRTVGTMFQDPHLVDEIDALSNVTLPGRIDGRPDDVRGRELLDAVGLPSKARAVPRTLSGGERQRVALARALYADPAIVLADEPTGSLDRSTATQVFALLVALARRRRRAVVMVTHDGGLVRDVDARYTLVDGTLVPDV